VTLHRWHLNVRMRDARREISLDRDRMPGATSAALAEQLLGDEARPSELAIRAETWAQLEAALARLDTVDREVLALRHFEQLSRSETARELGISEAAAGKRYLRALARLRAVLVDRGEGGDGGGPG
jgi:RNA polymerase sigma-70 factor (ECF subfamily)